MNNKLIAILGFVAAVGMVAPACGKSDSTTTPKTGGTSSTGGSTGGSVASTGGSISGSGGTAGSGGAVTSTGGAVTSTGGSTTADAGRGRSEVGATSDVAARITCGGETCGRNEPFCLNDSICAECLANTDCSGNQPVCNLTDGQCVQCTAKSDCDANETCSSNRCQPSCASDTDCSPVDGGRGNNNDYCNTSTSLCVECVSDTHCTTNEPYCVTNSCRQCRTNADCTNGGTCGTNGGCSTPRPDGGGVTPIDGGSGGTRRDTGTGRG